MAQKEKTDGMSIINAHIENKGFSNAYLLYGDEGYLVKQYKEKLVEALCDKDDSMNFIVYKGENAILEAIKEFAMTLPFFADRRVILVEGSGLFKKKDNDAFAEFLENIPETTVVIFVENEIDRTLKPYKRISKVGTAAEFSTPDERTLLTWIKSLFSREQMQIDDQAVYRLLESVGADMNTLVNETEKLKSYGLESKHVTLEMVEELCISQVESKVFDMMDALSQKNKTKTMQLYDDLLKLREPPMRLLALITRQFNILLKIKFALENGTDYSQIAGFAKVPPFAVKKYSAQCRGYTYKQLVECVEKCQQADGSIKSGKMKDGAAVELLIIELLN